MVLKQPEVSNLVRELRQLMQLTQVQLAAELGVAYETINRWENGHMQPSALALKQLRTVINQLSTSPSESLKDGSQALLQKYFGGKDFTQKDTTALHSITEKST
ncbi:helix-turn-helix domain-containing protein [Leptolyngbya sp. PL-A3]